MKKGLRWIVVGSGAVIVVLLVGWGVWNAVSGARLRAALDDIGASGLPTRIEDILPSPVPDEQNAALLLNRAFLLMAGGKTESGAQLPALAELGSFWKKDPREQLSAADAGAIKGRLDAPDIREILELLHGAADRPKCDFGLDYSKGAELPLPHLAKMQSAARLLALDAWSRASGGDAEGAMRSMRCGLRMGGFSFGDGLLISWLVGAACDTATLNWAGASLGRFDPGAVPPDALEALSREWVARRAEARSAFVRTTDTERLAFGAWAFEGVLAGRLRLPRIFAPLENAISSSGPGILRASAIDSYAWMGRPLLKEDYLAYLGLMLRYREMAAKPCDVAAADEFDRLLREVPKTAFLTRMTVPAYGTCVRRAGEYEVLLGVAQVGLALEISRARSGAYPERLSDVRGIGDAARDPFSGGELLYRREGDGCRVWSVGPDGKDDGGVRRVGGAKAYDVVWEVRRKP